MSGAEDEPGHALAIAINNLALDALAGEVCAALREAGIRAILLKGRATTQWLYASDRLRRYRDVDLLVDPAQERDAAATLGRLGFEPAPGIGVTDPGVAREHEWHRGSDGRVDLHVSLVGVEAPPIVLWQALSARTEPMRIGDVDIDILDRSARAFHLALHAAQHGRRERQPLDDLGRALLITDDDAWQIAAELSVQVGADSALVEGLRLHPEGRALVKRLGLTPDPNVAARLRAQSAPDLSLGIERFRSAPSWRARARQVRRAILPTPDFLRWWTPLARRGRTGLLLAYVWRAVWLVGSALPAWRSWRAAARRSGRPRR